MSTVQQDFKRRLARAEITASAVHPADLQAASHRQLLRTRVHLCEFIRERFLLMGLDPALAVSLHHGEDAAAELAAIPDTEALRTADEELTHSDLDDYREDALSVRAKIQRMADNIADDIIDKGVQPNFATAVGILRRYGGFSSGDQIKRTQPKFHRPVRASRRVPRVPKPEHRGSAGLLNGTT